MKDRELTRLLQAHPEEGLEAAMLEYAPLVKGILVVSCRRTPVTGGVHDRRVRRPGRIPRSDACSYCCACCRRWHGNRGINRYNALRRRETVTLDDGLAETLGELAEFDRATTEAAILVGALVAAMTPLVWIFFCANIICCTG